MSSSKYEKINVTFSLITQNNFKFYSLTLPSDVLADTCFVSTRYDDQEAGFQRLLDKKRAQEIAAYVDSGTGSIPNAVILSAQPDAEFEVKEGGRALSFKKHPKAFLVLDGQHRIWGYKLAHTKLRVPVVVYNNLTRPQETRLFIDINTKQKPVPNELLLDIKHLADMETSTEHLLRQLFDIFNKNSESALLGLLSPSEKSKGKLTRTNFNAAFRTLTDLIIGREAQELFVIFNAYFLAVLILLKRMGAEVALVSPIAFRAFVNFFPEIASKVKDRYEGEYTQQNFIEVLEPAFEKLPKTKLLKPGNSVKDLYLLLANTLTKNFEL